MASFTLFDDSGRHQLLPFTHTRPVADIRCGILTNRERWEHLLQQATSDTLSEKYFATLYNNKPEAKGLCVNAGVMATKALSEAVLALPKGYRLLQGKTVIAFHTKDADTVTFDNWESITAAYKSHNYEAPLQKLQHIWDIFSLNGSLVKSDYALLTQGRQSQAIPQSVTAVNPRNIFIEEGAILAPCILNASKGPVYIGRDAEIMDGAVLRGPVAVCEHATIKMAAKIYGDTTIGSGCKVGGEISNSVFFANSNKGHDGFLGNAVIGEWCNLGADTNCSNLKNNYDYIKIWDEHNNKSVQTGLQFCGLLMGDHSKSGINTMFNTGTVVGVSCNIYGAGFPEKFIPSFSWGDSLGMTTYSFGKACETANRMMERRGRSLDREETAMLQHIYSKTQHQRDIFNKS